jgi:hypothetical protein
MANRYSNFQPSIEDEIATLKRKLADLEKRAKQAESWDKLKTMPDGAVIVFDKTFGRQTYTYAAIKKNDRWFTTNTGGTDHESMVRFVGEAPFVIELKPANAHYPNGTERRAPGAPPKTMAEVMTESARY